MCGIIGVTGKEPASRILLDGLKSLEYRGYDSAGIAVQKDEGLVVLRRAGKLVELESVVGELEPFGSTGIGHARWATHGSPTESNAHPHLNGNDRVAVIHNGIIENHEELRREMEAAGCAFRSQTDTEVLAHMIEDFTEYGLGTGVQKAQGVVEGAYGLGVPELD